MRTITGGELIGGPLVAVTATDHGRLKWWTVAGRNSRSEVTVYSGGHIIPLVEVLAEWGREPGDASIIPASFLPEHARDNW